MWRICKKIIPEIYNWRNKVGGHLAFSSTNPKEDLIKMENWFKENNVEVRIGNWSENELWIDCPSIFINFVIEILNVD